MDQETRQAFRRDIVSLCEKYNDTPTDASALLYEVAVFLGIAVAVHSDYNDTVAMDLCSTVKNRIQRTCIETIAGFEMEQANDQGTDRDKGNGDSGSNGGLGDK